MSQSNGSSPKNGLANLLSLIGIALIVLAGILAYPSVRGWLGLETAPEGFGDETGLSVALVGSSESLPPNSNPPAALPGDDAAPQVLPETPLEPEATVAPEPTAPAAEPTAAPTLPPATPTPPPSGTDTPNTFTPGVPSRLVIPAIDLDAPVETVGWSVTTQNGQQVSMWDVPNRYAAGWLKTSALAGQPGNTVLDGHHNIDGEVFRYLVNLKQGDKIQVWINDEMREYTVSLLKILPEKGQPISVRLENAKWIQSTRDERLTLITCWPYENNTHRLVVVALPDGVSSEDFGAE